MPPGVIGVPTAVPVFVGYTRMATLDGKTARNRAIQIASLADYVATFGEGPCATFSIVEITSPGAFDFQVKDGSTTRFFRLDRNPATDFLLYGNLCLFFANGGSNAFVISVGSYDEEVGKEALLKGLDVAEAMVGPTLLVAPDALLLPPTRPEDPGVSADFQAVARAMLSQAEALKDRFAILDLYGSRQAGDANWQKIVEQFRADVGQTGLDYGAAYFPCLDATVFSGDGITFENIENLEVLQQILTWEVQNLYGGTMKAMEVQGDVDAMAGAVDPAQLNRKLTTSLPLLAEIEQLLTRKANILPPSGAMAGVYTAIDNQQGVWNAPANVTLIAVSQPSLPLDETQQAFLNLPIDGKAVNAIRQFVVRGSVVWGSRTLDGNSPDDRFIQVRRTLIYVEQSIRIGLQQFVFAPNDAQTWVTVVSTVSAFLTNLWSQGGLMGSKASEAYTVQCGLGSTMTAQDILEGYMIVQVTLQMVRPAEFIELTFKQKIGELRS